MSTIFELDRESLESLALFLRPALETIRIDKVSIERLRALITEWLLLNNKSTMHSFEKTELGTWVWPNKEDCQSCGKYKVGRREYHYLHKYWVFAKISGRNATRTKLRAFPNF